MARSLTSLGLSLVCTFLIHSAVASAAPIDCPGPLFRDEGTLLISLTGPGFEHEDFIYLNRYPNGNVRADIKTASLSGVDGWLVLQLHSDQLGNNYPHLGRVQDVEIQQNGQLAVNTRLEVEFTTRLVSNIRLRDFRSNKIIRYQVNFESQEVDCYDEGEEFPHGASPDRIMLRYGPETLAALTSVERLARLNEELAAERSMTMQCNTRNAELDGRVISLERQSAEDGRMIDNQRRALLNWERALRDSERQVTKLERISTELHRGLMVYTPTVALESKDAETRKRLRRIVRRTKRQIAMILES